MDPRLQLIIDMNKKEEQRRGYPARAKDVPVTQKMLYLVRDSLDAKVSAVDHQIHALEHKMDMRFDQMEARFDRLAEEIHRIALLVEEQNAKNNIVLDGLTSLFGRQERVEKRISQLEK